MFSSLVKPHIDVVLLNVAMNNGQSSGLPENGGRSFETAWRAANCFLVSGQQSSLRSGEWLMNCGISRCILRCPSTNDLHLCMAQQSAPRSSDSCVANRRSSCREW